MDLLEYEFISNYLITGNYPPGYNKDQKRELRRKSCRFCILGGKLVKSSKNQDLFVITKNEVDNILKEVHDNSGHQCSRYSYKIAKDRYFWPCMQKDITLYVQACARCLKNQPSLKSPTNPLQPLPVITKVWFRVGMDLTGPLVESNGYKYILTVIDHFTRWIETRPLRTNGLVESSHKALKLSLVKTLDGKKENWSVYLEEITFSLNIRPRQTTQFSAFELMHGSRKPRLPIQAENLAALYPDAGALDLDEWAGEEQINEFIDTMQEAQMDNQEIAGESLKHSKTLMKKQYDKRLNPVTLNTIEKGDEVLIENRRQARR